MSEPADARRVEVQISWHASSLTRAIATCAGTALAAALITGRWELIAFAAPLLGVLCAVGFGRTTSPVHGYGRPVQARCFENEQSTFEVWASADDAEVPVLVDVVVPEGMSVETIEAVGDRRTVAVAAPRWGRYPVTVAVEAVARGGLLVGRGRADVADVFVFPEAPPQSTRVPRTELLDRLGTHLTRHVGPGVEYADVRPYVAGDPLRTVNWPVSARRGRLHVTERLTDRSADVVVMVDTTAQPPGPATRATERSVRGAVQVVQSALRGGDRAGVITLGARRTQWLGADIGRRQFYRVLDAVLGAGDEFESTAGTLAPRAAVPPGAIIVAFSTLLDTDFAVALIDLCKRGHLVVAVDVMPGSPFADEQEQLISRMWALQRSAMYRDMATIGVDVVAWHADSTLDQSLQLIPDHRRPARSRR